MRTYYVRPHGGGPVYVVKAFFKWAAKIKAKRLCRRYGWPGFRLTRLS